MELEFDKEIDAILRKARSGTSAAATSADSSHLDADSIAAFVENALPQASKLLYMEHIADCDRCRRILSQTVTLDRDESSDIAAAITPPIEQPIAETVLPWYKRFFNTPEMAMTLGALVLAFSGLLGYIVMQNTDSAAKPELSRATEQQPTQGGPFYGGEADYPSANKAAAVSDTANVVAANSASGAMPMNTAANTAANSSGLIDAPSGSAAGNRAVSAAKPEASADDKSIAASPPPPAPITSQPPTSESDAKSDGGSPKAKEQNARLAATSTDERMARDAAPPAKKNTAVRSGPSNAQAQTQNVITESSLRSVGGKSFDRRGGVWYDLAYKGQSTKKVTRGSNDYRKLDGGLRNIGDSLDGTVVVVWKEKAYRIQ
ncbi:MAG: hypothetical protein IPI76_05875 [Chloracidobacterium sp.]|nr:hypothetical protein [Chloracidobacterium sp.]